MIGQVHGEDSKQGQTTEHVEQLDAFGRGDGRDRGACGDRRGRCNAIGHANLTPLGEERIIAG
jgi:hypothetical protein